MIGLFTSSSSWLGLLRSLAHRQEQIQKTLSWFGLNFQWLIEGNIIAHDKKSRRPVSGADIHQRCLKFFLEDKIGYSLTELFKKDIIQLNFNWIIF